MILIGQEPWRNISYVIGEPQYNQVQRFYYKSKPAAKYRLQHYSGMCIVL